MLVRLFIGNWNDKSNGNGNFNRFLLVIGIEMKIINVIERKMCLCIYIKIVLNICFLKDKFWFWKFIILLNFCIVSSIINLI